MTLEALRTKVLFFFVKILRVSWIILSFFFFYRAYDVWIIYTLDKLSYPFLSMGQLKTFHPLHFQCHEIFLRIPLIWRLLPASLPLGHLHPFCYTLSSFMLIFALLSSSGCISSVFWMAAVPIFQGQQFLLYNSI